MGILLDSFCIRGLASIIIKGRVITSWGSRLYSEGVGNFFGDELGGGVKIKWPMGRGGHVFRQVLEGGSDVFH